MRSAKGRITPAYEYHVPMAISLDALIVEWEDAGYGPLLAEARKRRQEQERAGDEAVLKYFRQLRLPRLPDGDPE